jgi:hypothetical protein
MKNANLLSAISISGLLVTRRSNFLKSHITLMTYYALFGQLASRRVPCPPDIGSVWCNVIFQVSNRTIGCILKRSARLYGECTEPNHMAKCSVTMLTDLTEIPYKKITFYVVTP